MCRRDLRYPIIDAPNNRRPLARRLEWLAMLAATGAVWFFFIRYIAVELVSAWDTTKDMAVYLSFVFFMAMGILVYWQVFNYLMYGKKERRKAFPNPEQETVARLYGITVNELTCLTEPREITLYAKDKRYYLSLASQATIELGLFNQRNGARVDRQKAV